MTIRAVGGVHAQAGPAGFAAYRQKRAQVAGTGPAKASTVVNLRQTRIESLTVPATHEIHGTFDASGKVQELNGNRWQAAASATVARYDRSLPKGKWVYAGSVTTSSGGAFAWRYQIHRLGKFAWQARVEPTTVGSTRYKASESAAKFYRLGVARARGDLVAGEGEGSSGS